MDRVGVYAVWDTKSNLYDIPFFARNDMMARRRFILDIRSRENGFLQGFKDDYELYRIALWSYDNAAFTESIEMIIAGKGVDYETK